jgi:hypothetical protein
MLAFYKNVSLDFFCLLGVKCTELRTFLILQLRMRSRLSRFLGGAGLAIHRVYEAL